MQRGDSVQVGREVHDSNWVDEAVRRYHGGRYLTASESYQDSAGSLFQDIIRGRSIIDGRGFTQEELDQKTTNAHSFLEIADYCAAEARLRNEKPDDANKSDSNAKENE